MPYDWSVVWEGDYNKTTLRNAVFFSGKEDER